MNDIIININTYQLLRNAERLPLFTVQEEPSVHVHGSSAIPTGTQDLNLFIIFN